jgi:drug/metabolite transporter (DMT)-like permease
VLVALVARQETQPSPTRLAGLVLGFAGTLLIFQPWQGGNGSELGGELACLAAAASYGLAYVYMARHLIPRHPSPFVLAYGQMVAAALLLVPALIVAGRQPIDLNSSVTWSMVALGPIGTGMAYVVNYAIVASEGATVASTVTYLLPSWLSPWAPPRSTSRSPLP